MAFTNIGGREYYTNVRGLSSGGGGVMAGAPLDTTTGGITNCVGIGRVKGIMTMAALHVTKFRSRGPKSFRKEQAAAGYYLRNNPRKWSNIPICTNWRYIFQWANRICSLLK